MSVVRCVTAVEIHNPSELDEIEIEMNECESNHNSNPNPDLKP